MKTNKLSGYFFSLIPVLALVSLVSFGSHSTTKLSAKKSVKPDGTVEFLPCSFPNKGVLSGEAATFFTNSAKPILQYGDNSPYGYYDVPAHVVVGTNELVVQSDGNLSINENGVNCWNSGTGGRPLNAGHRYQLWFQADGNLVLKEGATVLWASNKYSSCSGSQYAYYTFQSDGNLVMRYPCQYQGDLSSHSHVNVTSYFLAESKTASGHHNSNHKIE